ncbi:uncharacterized protein [Physcomitrium patens]|uniref:C2 domain-containing protein n=1 Tax=Physcomitrium patens TaxID=3218 RepID=A9SG81_PHYPA|nr:uncharacterized protein LOC112284437 [Physcomitrium patens]PNR51150.1 hypothetical protein PHYPA_010336 [Physcomitrium patens]|eukprot:XP_024379989.1 uncharacterized protein LOC112284437 [Physcomitrella patens]
MADRKLEVLLKSATDLKKVNKTKMHAYAVAWVDPIIRVPGPVDRINGSNPVWETPITLTLKGRSLGQSSKLNIELLGLGFVSTKPIGSVVVDLAEILQQGASGAAVKKEYVNYPVFLPSGASHGSISFDLRLKECRSMLAAQVAQGNEDTSNF